MKNFKFSLHPFLALRPARWLSFAVLFLMVSCRKDTEMAIFENSDPIVTSAMATARSSGLEGEVVQYAQWMLKNVVPLVEDPSVYEDIKAGNYGTARLQSKIGSLGFSSFASFSSQFAAKGDAVNEAIRSGLLTEEQISLILKTNLTDQDLGVFARQDGSPGGTPTPCYDQLIDNLALVAGEVAIGSFGGPWGAVAAGIIGVTAAYISFNNCLDENYPR